MNRAEVCRPLRVVQLVDDLRQGGAQRLLVDWAKFSHTVGIESTVVSLGAAAPTYQRELLAASVPVVEVASTRRHELFDRRRRMELLGAMRSLEPFEVIHAHLGAATQLSVDIGRRLAVPVVATLHSTPNLAPLGRDRVKRRLMLRALRRCDRRLGVSTHASASWSSLIGAQGVRTIANPLTSWPRPVSRHQGHSVVVVGRLVSSKRVTDVIRAVAVVRQRLRATRLVIVGDGPERVAAETLAQELGMGDSVDFLGPRDDVADLLSRADVYVSASEREALSLALLEGLGAGLPIVATAVGDHGSIIDKVSGFKVAIGDIEQLARGIEHYLRSPQVRQQAGDKGREYVATHHRFEDWLQRLADVYEDVAELPVGAA